MDEFNKCDQGTENCCGNEPFADSEGGAPNFVRSAGGQYTGSQSGAYQNGFGAQGSDTANAANGGADGIRFIDPEYYARRKAGIKLGNAVGIPLCLFFVVSIGLNLLIELLLIATSGIEATARLFSDPNIVYLLNACITLVSFTVPFLYTLKVTGRGFGELIAVNRVPFSKGVSLVMLGVGATVLCNYITAILSTLVQTNTGIELKSSMQDFGTGKWSFVITLLCVGILPAVIEEFALRGVVLGALRTRMSDTSSILVSAALFGLLHGNLVQMPFAFLMGIILGFATVYSGSIVPSVIIHALNNSISVVMSFATSDMSPMVSNVTVLLYYAVSLVIGVCGFIMLIKTDPDAFRLSKRNSEHTSESLKWFCCAPSVIIFLIICVLEVLAVQGVF